MTLLTAVLGSRSDCTAGLVSGPVQHRFLNENGQAIIEYVLVVLIVSIALIVSVVALTGNIGALFDPIIAFFAARF